MGMAGRLVDVLEPGQLVPAGTHSVTWLGCDLHGKAMPSGTYFYRLDTEGHSSTKRMTLAR